MVSLQNPRPQSNPEKNIRQIPDKGLPTKFLVSPPQTAKVIQNKDSLRNRHSPEELRRQDD